MREYLFRGKRLEDGGWVRGSVIQSTESTCIARSDMSDENQWAFTYEVDPYTVCQYTWLEDSHEIKIFEGDIIRVAEGAHNYEVCFVNSGFKMVEVSDPQKTPWPLSEVNTLAGVEVVGNRFDNPELLNQ